MKPVSRYLVKEHLILEDGEKIPQVLQLLRERLLAFSMSLMPRGNVHKCELALRVGKTLHAFVGKLPTPDFYGLVGALEEGKNLEFIGLYDYEWEPWWEESQGADPYGLESFFLKAGQTEGLFYSMYAGEDLEPGEVIAFGKKNGRQYRGVVPYVPLEELPNQGRWFAPVSGIHCTQEDLKKIDIHRLLPVCRRLCNLGGEQELYFAGHCFNFSLRNLELYSAEQLGKYLTLCRALQEVTGGKAEAYPELADLSTADPRMLVLDVLPDGKEALKITML